MERWKYELLYLQSNIFQRIQKPLKSLYAVKQIYLI